jgi:hypothetical protein
MKRFSKTTGFLKIGKKRHAFWRKLQAYKWEQDFVFVLFLFHWSLAEF